MKNINIYIIISGIALLGLGFGGGYFAGKNTAKKVFQNGFQQFVGQQGGVRGQAMGQGGGQGSRGGMSRPVAGEIISADDKSITVKMTDGNSRIVLINDATEINKASTVSKAELKVGEKVSVFGQSNSDGSVSAQNIQLNPLFRNLDSGSTGSNLKK